jgi:hypothetical protein
MSRRDLIIAGVAVVAVLVVVYMEMPSTPAPIPAPTNPGALSKSQSGSGLFANPSGLGANPAPAFKASLDCAVLQYKCAVQAPPYVSTGPVAELPRQIEAVAHAY